MNECCMEKGKLTIKNINDTTQLNYRFLHKNCEPVFAYLAVMLNPMYMYMYIYSNYSNIHVI